MKIDSFFPDNVKAALKNDPPGEWMPALPKKCIRLSSGYPAPKLVPSGEIKAAAARLLDEEQDLPLHYLGTPRMEKLKQQIQNRLAERNIKVQEDELLITAGACQAIDLIARVLLDENVAVAVEAPTYMEALEIFRNYTNQIISIPIDDQGLRTNELAQVLAERKSAGLTLPRLLYTIPTFQNPTGTTLSGERRNHLLELAAEYDFLILEDDAYGELSFGESPTTLKTLDTVGRVLHVGSLSKVVAPGMRVGWIVGESEFITAFSWFKKDLDHPFAQATMAAYLEKVDLDERLTELKTVYRSKSERLAQYIKKYFPESVSWYVPQGGYFVWVKVPGVDTAEMLEKALAAGVSYVPGRFFFANQQEGIEYLRLSFSYESEERMEAGVQILGELIASYLKKTT
ncbi:PLP-dependent aminotransferase family protein [Neobacillus citreus]|uniref:PLP-dependent aminotransferase family protein n=1 Tax=Neobacillus citreus TaxID=2833578 RepID=A0A942T3K8_9BACI|nr:PLP-dependent aminotransferase family protein [Neobacillus citreus]